MDDSTLVGGALGLLIALALLAILVVVFRWLWNTTLPPLRRHSRINRRKQHHCGVV
ncbi:MAG: hypothetical protein MUF67_13950 [Desulfobacterales bacterium]|jgi:hypothetical protein|nr:hypothetical protein [Desulfobacterales bacterium]